MCNEGEPMPRNLRSAKHIACQLPLAAATSVRFRNSSKELAWWLEVMDPSKTMLFFLCASRRTAVLFSGMSSE